MQLLGLRSRWAAACALVTLLSGCTASAETEDVGRAVQCVPFDAVGSIDQLNAQIDTTKASPYFLGADVGASARLSDGRSIWVFGDTIRGADVSGDRMVRNSMLMYQPGCLLPVVPPGGGAVIPDRDALVGYWPMSIAVVPQKGFDIVGVTAQRVTGSGNAWSFQTLGPAIAVFKVEPGEQPELIEVTDLGPDDASTERPNWGAASAIAPDGYVYLYGTSKPADGSSFGYAVQVARAAVADVPDQAKWTYWDGAAWQGDPAKAAVLVQALGGVSQTFSVVFKNGKTYLISKRDEALGEDLIAWVGDMPQGPFTASGSLAYIPSQPDKHLWVYMPIAHPDLLTKPDSVVVSVSRNSDDLSLVLADPTLYRPFFLEITLPD